VELRRRGESEEEWSGGGEGRVRTSGVEEERGVRGAVWKG
jgi:hypothetical protein